MQNSTCDNNLRSLIRLVLQESSFFGSAFDKFKSKALSGEAATTAAESSGFVEIGRGTFRKVYASPDNDSLVLKVAYADTNDDLELAKATNRDEANNLMATKNDLLPKVYERDPAGLWILSEKVRRIKDQAELQSFFPEADISRSEFIFPLLLGLGADKIRLSPSEFDKKMIQMSTNPFGKRVVDDLTNLQKNSIFGKLVDSIAEFNIEETEVSPKNLGVVTRPDGETFVLLDISTGLGLRQISESLLREYLNLILFERSPKKRHGKRHRASERQRQELEQQGYLPVEEENVEKDKRILYHIGSRPAEPKPGRKGDASAGDLSAVYMTSNPEAIRTFHGIKGNVYAYSVPEWVIQKSGGMKRYDTGTEIRIYKDVWDEAGDEIEFLRKSYSADKLSQSSEEHPTRFSRAFGTRPGWMDSREWEYWKSSSSARSHVYGLRSTNHPENAIKMMTPEERLEVLAAFEQVREEEHGTGRMKLADLEIVDLLKKYMNESLLREYVKEKLISESKLSGNTIEGLFQILDGYSNNTWIFFDTETTGFKPSESQLTEIAAIAVNPNQWKSEATDLGMFNEKIKLSQDTIDAMERQKSEEFLSQKSKKDMTITDILSMTRYGKSGGEYGEEQEVLTRFFEFVNSFPSPLLIAQNAAFDLKFVNVRSVENLPRYPVIDTQQIMQNYLIPLLKTQARAEEGDPAAQSLLNRLYIRRGNWGYHSVSMGVVSKAYGIDIDDWHNALADVKMMMEMYRKVVETISRGMEVDISKEQGKMLARQKQKKRRR